jgi:hypothetical protein
MEHRIGASMAEKGYKPPFRRIAGSPLWPYWLGLLLAFGVLYKGLEAAGRQTLEFWFNSDYLFAAHVYKDVFIDKFPFSGIKFSIAPDIFPDVVVTSVLMFLTRNAVVATFLYGLVQFTLLIWAYVLCARVINRSRPEVSQAPILVVGIGVTLWTASIITRPYDSLYYNLFLDQSHVSSTALGVISGAAGTWLCFTSLKRKSARLVLAAVAVVCALAASSNLMFVPHMLLPFTCAVATMIFLDLVAARRCCCVLGVYWGGAITGIWLGRKLVDSGTLASQASLDVDRLTAALNIYLRGMGQKLGTGDLLHISALAWLACSLTAILWLVRRHVVCRDTFGSMEEPARRFIMVVLFLFISSVGCVVSIIVMGVQGLADFSNYAWSMHYQYPLFFGGIFGLALLGGLALRRIAAPRGAGAVVWIVRSVAVLAPLGMLLGGPTAPASLARYRPPLVDALDAVASKYGLKYGLGGFWQARSVNMFSRTGLRLYPVSRTLEPFHWLGNKYWYAGYPGSAYPHPSYDFVVLNDPLFQIDRQMVVSRFGEPAAEEMAGDVPVMIYNRPSDRRLASMFRCIPPALQALYAPGTHAIFSGSCLAGSVGTIEGEHRIAREGQAASGFLSYGPYMAVEPGVYSIALQCKGRSGVGKELGTWDVGFYDRVPPVTLDGGRILAGATEIGGRFAIPSSFAGRPLEVRVAYAGVGDLEVDYLRVSRDK